MSNEREDAFKALKDVYGSQVPVLPGKELGDYVEGFFQKREAFLSLLEENPAPLYVLDEANLRRQAQAFRKAFGAVFPAMRAFYAMKSNNHPQVAAILVKEGLGLDVSSGVELETALSVNAREILFSGPGKTSPELALAAANADRVTVLMDSFGELERLDAQARKMGRIVRAGVRITPPSGSWCKFGIPLDRLRLFFSQAEKAHGVDLCGIQFHTSWNLDASAQAVVIQAIGREISQWPHALQRRITFLDMGGGYWPPAGEWLRFAATGAGRIQEMAGLPDARPLEHFRAPAKPLEHFASVLHQDWSQSIAPITPCRVYLEPGRWLSHGAMHLLLTVVDVKEKDMVITDAGTNALGWERFESDYAPILNLTRPALEEKPCRILGSLCTPHDLWGMAYWGQDIQPGDVLLIPDQGAYTYSLRQHFIKALPQVAVLAGNTSFHPG